MERLFKSNRDLRHLRRVLTSTRFQSPRHQNPSSAIGAFRGLSEIAECLLRASQASLGFEELRLGALGGDDEIKSHLGAFNRDERFGNQGGDVFVMVPKAENGLTSLQCRGARAMLRWTVEELAQRVGVSKNTVTRAIPPCSGRNKVIVNLNYQY